MPIFFSYFFNARFKWYYRQLLENLTMKVEKQSMLRSYEIIRVLTLKYIYIYIYIYFFFFGNKTATLCMEKTKGSIFIYLLIFYSCRVTHITN